MNKKIVSSALSALLLLSGTGIVSASARETEIISSGIELIIQEQQGDNSVSYYDQNGNEIDITDLNNDVYVNDYELPSSYDLRNENRVTPVRDQGSEGLCWDFAATASIESNILTQKQLSAGIENPPHANLDLSEAGNSWYIHTPSIDKNSIFSYDYIADPAKGANGGSADIVASSLFCGYGTYPEELLPYSKWNNGYSPSLRFYSDYRLKEFNQLSKDEDLIKRKIIDNGAVALRYGCFNSNTYMTDGMQAYYDNGFPIDGNYGMGHLVAVVGWDDSFSKERFNPLMQPQNDGAWLCKNSWGENNCSTAEGYEGYFWMSYETDITDFYQFEMQGSNEFDNIYQNQGVADFSVNLDSAANVFTAQSDEVIKQIGFRSVGALNAKVEIFKLNNGFSSPTDGSKICEFKAAADFAGIHMFDCPKGISLAKGDVFSVAVTNEGSEMFISLSQNRENEQPGLSFVKHPDNTWQDASNTEDGFASIKVFTSNASGVADKTKLISLIESAELINDDTIDKEISDEIKLQCENAQRVVDNESATQAQVNNAYYMLDSSIYKLSSAKIEINSIEDYYELSNNASSFNVSDIKLISLNTDLDLEGKELPPLLGKMSFSGVFDGNNHRISNFTLGNSYSEFVGVFTTLEGAEIKNLTLSDCVAESNDNAQLLAGKCTDTKFTNCKIENAQISSGAYAGAISSNQYNVVANGCYVVNTKIYGEYGAGIYFGGGIAEIDSSCSYSGVELYSFNLITNNNQAEVSAFPADFGSKESHILSFNNNEFFIEGFTAKISSLNPYNSKVEKVADNKYKVTDIDSNAYIEVSYAKTEEDFTAKGDLKTRKLYLTGYTGNDSDIVIPSSLNGKDVVGFDEEFNSSIAKNGNIKSVTVPGVIKDISPQTFSSVYSLEKVTLCEGVETISSAAFSQCKRLESVILPNSLKKIGSAAFMDCESLSDITFPKGLESISDEAFVRCVSLPAPTMPDSLKTIGYIAFAGCTFTGVTLGKGIEEIGDDAFAFTSKSQLDYRPVYIPDFTVNGYCSTAAEEFAEKYGFNFVDIKKNPPLMDGRTFDYGIFIAGDVDLDGIVTVSDATLIMKWLAKKSELTPIQLSNAIVGDNRANIDINNATLIQKYLAKLVDTLDSSAMG